MFRTRFKNGILAEFLPPQKPAKRERLIILCDGMPSVPRKQPLAKFLAGKGFWVFYPRYRGAWESDGIFLDHSPHQDILSIIDQARRGVTEIAFGRSFKPDPQQVFVIGGSFGGAAALLASIDSRVDKVIANCPVVDWSILRSSEKTETSNRSYVAYIKQGFGEGYRLTEANWRKLYSGKFFNPLAHAHEIDPAKVMMFHAKDDPHVPWKSVENFAKLTGARLKLFSRGGHMKTEIVIQRHWTEISRFFAD